MTACIFSASTFIVGFLISGSASFLAHRHILARLKSTRQKSAWLAAAMFIILLAATFGLSQVCTGPLLGESGEIIA